MDFELRRRSSRLASFEPMRCRLSDGPARVKAYNYEAEKNNRTASVPALNRNGSTERTVMLLNTNIAHCARRISAYPRKQKYQGVKNVTEHLKGRGSESRDGSLTTETGNQRLVTLQVRSIGYCSDPGHHLVNSCLQHDQSPGLWCLICHRRRRREVVVAIECIVFTYTWSFVRDDPSCDRRL
jgi:hypothetical protein